MFRKCTICWFTYSFKRIYFAYFWKRLNSTEPSIDEHVNYFFSCVKKRRRRKSYSLRSFIVPTALRLFFLFHKIFIMRPYIWNFLYVFYIIIIILILFQSELKMISNKSKIIFILITEKLVFIWFSLIFKLPRDSLNKLKTIYLVFGCHCSFLRKWFCWISYAILCLISYNDLLWVKINNMILEKRLQFTNN